MERLTVTQPIILLLKGTLKNALLPTQLRFLIHISQITWKKYKNERVCDSKNNFQSTSSKRQWKFVGYKLGPQSSAIWRYKGNPVASSFFSWEGSYECWMVGFILINNGARHTGIRLSLTKVDCVNIYWIFEAIVLLVILFKLPFLFHIFTDSNISPSTTLTLKLMR